jgi:DNA-binding protein WhiA
MGNFDQMRSDLELDVNTPKHIISTAIAKRAYVAGAFLSGGSISSIDKSVYHLEIRSNKIKYLRTIQTILTNFNVSITLLPRRYGYVLYVKRANDVSDFLKIIGANQAMQELEDKIILRDYYNSIHRLNNLDVANLKKTTTAANTQIQMINAIKTTGLINSKRQILSIIVVFG